MRVNAIKASVTFIVIVNFRTPDLAIESLRSISMQNEALNGGQVIVVDNFSEDESVQKIQSAITTEGWASWVQLLQMNRNGGFAYGNNAGIKHALASHSRFDYLMLLNPDTLVRKNAMRSLIKFMNAHLLVGVAGSRLENASGGIESSAHQFPSPVGELVESARLNILTKLLAPYALTPARQDTAHRCDWVSGASLMIRRAVFEDVGFLDENFFLYFEEVDFFQRVAKTNWQVWYVPKSLVMHIEGAATGIKQVKRRPSYWLYSRRRYFVKHYGILGLVTANILWTLGWISFKLRRFLHLGAQGSTNEPPWLTLDIIWGDFKAIFSGEVFKIKREKVL